MSWLIFARMSLLISGRLVYCGWLENRMPFNYSNEELLSLNILGPQTRNENNVCHLQLNYLSIVHILLKIFNWRQKRNVANEIFLDLKPYYQKWLNAFKIMQVTYGYIAEKKPIYSRMVTIRSPSLEHSWVDTFKYCDRKSVSNNQPLDFCSAVFFRLTS